MAPLRGTEPYRVVLNPEEGDGDEELVRERNAGSSDNFAGPE